MKVLQFIVIESNHGSGTYEHTVTGECYIPCNTPVPIIRKGHGCIGIGVVKSLLITAESTRIEYDSREISKEKKKAYYDLYRNNMSVSDVEDPYANTDQVIPGAMVGKKNKDRFFDRNFDDYDDLF